MSASNQSVDDVSGIQLFDIPTLKHPFDAYKRLRDHAPVFFDQVMNLHVVTRYDLLREAIRDTETYSSKFDGFLLTAQQMMFNGLPDSYKVELTRIRDEMTALPPTMLTLDEPEHTKYRSLVSKLFTFSQVRKMEPYVRSIIMDTLESFVAKREVDFMQVFGFPVPLRVIADRLGIPPEDREFFNEAATAAAAGLRLSPVPPEEMVLRAQSALDLQKLLIGLVEARRSEPREDMISILANSKLEDEDRQLTHGECLSILNQFLVAGHETTTSTFGWGMLILCQNSEIQDQIRDDEKLTKTFVEEVLRLEAPVQGLPRLVTRDTELGGYPLQEGDMIMLRYGAANRDERQFSNPDVPDIHREKPGLQMAFGSGVHHCIGAPLARQELNLGFPALLKRMENIRLAPGHPEPEAEPSFILRNLPELHIEYDLRGN